MTTTHVDRLLAPGDVVLIEFGPVRGTEQDGRRPGLIVSVDEMHDITRRAIVCPITRNLDPWPTKVFLPQNSVVQGAILTDQVRSIDRQARILRRLGAVPGSVLEAARHQLALALGLRTE